MKFSSSQYPSLLLMTVLIICLLSGCSKFVIKDEDDGATIIGKVMYRTVFAIGTLGISEIKIREAAREHELEQRLAVYEARVMGFLEKGEITRGEAERMILKEKARLWSDKENF